MSIFTSRRFYVALVSVVLLAAAALVPDAFEGVNVEELAGAIADVAVPIAGVVMALLASYGLRQHV